MDLILQLKSVENRVAILTKLNSKRESDNHLAELLWHSPGTVAILLEGICKQKSYPYTLI